MSSQSVAQAWTTSSTATAPAVDGGRLLRRIEELGRIGRDPVTGGITREGFSAADREARAYVMAEARAAGLCVAVDAAGNIIIRGSAAAAGERPVVLMGSHLDTVVNGGRLDGAYGVIAALEVVQAWAESGGGGGLEPVAVAFTNEEGALFPQPFFGSMVLAGRLAGLPREPLDHQGGPLRGPLALAGGDLDALGSAAWSSDAVAAYLEVHVEQGPVLERAGSRIGVVDGITGRDVLTVEIRGTAGHAGTTPMAGRADALAAASRVVLAAERIAAERGLCRVATVGRLHISPNSPNTVAEAVRLTADLRDTDAARMRNAEAALRDALADIARQTGTDIEVVGRVYSDPVATSADLRALIEETALELGVPYAVLPSGAGHDALVVADLAPVAMIFVPSIGGVSHVPEEDTAPDDLVLGAEVLLRTALRASGLPTGPRR
ncbi:Zn-dependent hydrolase [Streptomyces sp. NBC_00503]|uniref:Zn-dependent hydrolase n=1 Tax=Streptomyces sp. NBC_00503 TaxID=2903659 RepID=UPI002E815665|nr:Zn-dependent hydrolase [Streptomyces sp. NBC_00503]WUD86393.1 Zn-dependent hydrolase [Streptomyces sp. NBC_00503]